MATVITPEMRSWRIKIFTSTWLTYFGFYFCRKAFYAVKGELATELGINTEMLGYIGFVYLLSYTLGQFSVAWAGTKFGPRNLLLVGMIISIVSNIAFGFSTNLWTIMSFMILNGFAQATGWPSTIGVMANWTTRSERGTIMGFWGTCFQFGGLCATWWASMWMAIQGWRGSFFAASVVLFAVWIYVYLVLQNKPQDVGLEEFVDEIEERESPEQEKGNAGNTETSTTISQPPLFSRNVLITVLLVGCFYFGVKFVRYALWSWTPYLLNTQFGLASVQAGYMSTIFDLFGFMGAITAGVLSDKVFKGRRTTISLIMLCGMVLGCGILFYAGSIAGTVEGDYPLTLFGCGLAVVGFMLFGPDALLTGAGAMDLGSKRSALAAAGIINGMGSIGSMAQEIILPQVMAYSEGGIVFLGRTFSERDSTFAVLILASIFALFPLLVVAHRNKTGQSDL
jgi:sugar phosphate permease